MDTYEGACEALAFAADDVRNDMGEEAVDECWQDIVVAVAVQYPREIALELCRTEIGWVPREVYDALDSRVEKLS